MLELFIIALLSEPSPDLSGMAKNHYDTIITVPAKNPGKVLSSDPPDLLKNSELSVLAIDHGTGKTLFNKAEKESHHIASLTKLMTYYVIRKENSLDDMVQVSPAATRTYGVQIHLYEYERIGLDTLLEAILIPSANDAAKALAIYNADSEAAFVEKMNKYAKELGLDSADFVNSTGLDVFAGGDSCDIFSGENCDKTYGNQMSAEDLGKLVRILLNTDPLFREIIQKDHFYGTSENSEFFHEKSTTNQFLLDPSFGTSKGVKTGYTVLAGECFINLSENKSGDEFITIVLGSVDRFGESKKLLQWILKNFTWQ